MSGSELTQVVYVRVTEDEHMAMWEASSTRNGERVLYRRPSLSTWARDVLMREVERLKREKEATKKTQRRAR